MFTGIIEGFGKVLKLERKHQEIVLCIQPQFVISQYQQGESIAVNGVCLTVTHFAQNWFKTYVSSETFAKTNLAFLKVGSLVNLERALVVGSRLGGHFVTGHVDTVAQLVQCKKVGSSKQMTFLIDQIYNDLLIEKGSIALDGISLTINDCDSKEFSINVIPETQNNTTMSQWNSGYKANVEIDLIAKHIQKKLGHFSLCKQNENLKNILTDF
jgi:riboflavin synthase